MDGNTLARAMGHSLSARQYAEYADDFTRALIQARCTTVQRVAMFCAQVGHESAGLKYMEEIASGAAYEGRRDLGNIHPGDGRRFKGRGPIQLTGRHNYGQFGKWAASVGLVRDPGYFQQNPTVVATSRWGFLAASWYWTVARPRLNVQADAGDIVGATRSVNGGTNGLTDRRRRWNDCLRIGNALLAGTPPGIPNGETELDMATLDEVAAIVREYVPSGLFFSVTLPRSADRVRTATVPVPPRNGVITGSGAVHVSLTCGEKAEITEIYAEQDWTPDGKRGQKHALQGRYTLQAGDRQPFTIPAACTQISIVYQSDADLYLGGEVDPFYGKKR